MNKEQNFQYFWGVAIISFFVMAFEVSLTRYFSTALWSTYGYPIVSIALFGFAVSGTFLTLFKKTFENYYKMLLYLIPLILLPVVVTSYLLLGMNDFNILEFQNKLLWGEQIKNIGMYYIILFLPYFMSGLYIGIVFVVCHGKIGTVYAFDLIGAAVGAILILILMFFVHPFYLIMALLPFLFIASIIGALNLNKKFISIAIAILTFLVSSTAFLMLNTAHYSRYKPIFAPLNVEGNSVKLNLSSPRGFYQVLDNFTERVDISLTNNYDLLKIKELPKVFGVYRDGFRETDLKKSDNIPVSEYVNGTLHSLAYKLIPNVQDALVVGLGGGFRIREALSLGAKNVTSVEPNPDFITILQKFKDLNKDILSNEHVSIVKSHPRAFIKQKYNSFDIVDISPQLIPQQNGSNLIYTVEAIDDYIKALKDDGIVSIPINIKDNYIYAVKLIEIVKDSLEKLNVNLPKKHIIIYRSAWEARILISKQNFKQEQIDKLKAFCDERSFDIVYYSGMKKSDIETWNELPEIVLNDDSNQTQNSNTPILLNYEDPLLSASYKILEKNDEEFLQSNFFNLSSVTDNSPFFTIIKNSNLSKIIDNLDLFPIMELGYLINWIILAQALVLAVFVLLLPLLKRKTYSSKEDRLKMTAYFISLGLGFLFIEITLIEKFQILLNDPTYSFAIVLCGMLIFSGLGSYISSKIKEHEKKYILFASIFIGIAMIFYIYALDILINLFLGQSIILQIIFVILTVGFPSLFLGMYFPLGMSQLSGDKEYFIPWAWSINGAFSVISSVLAKILFVAYGFNIVLAIAGIIYLFAWFVFPYKKKQVNT